MSRSQFRAHSSVTPHSLLDNYVAQKEREKVVNPFTRRGRRQTHRAPPALIAGAPPIDPTSWWKLYVLGTNMRATATLQHSYRREAWSESVRTSSRTNTPRPPPSRSAREASAIADRFMDPSFLERSKQTPQETGGDAKVARPPSSAPAPAAESPRTRSHRAAPPAPAPVLPAHRAAPPAPSTPPKSFAFAPAPASLVPATPLVQAKTIEELAAAAGCTVSEYREYYGTTARGSPIPH